MEKKEYDSVDRPLECSECRKKAEVLYTEITRQGTKRLMMCADCPYLKKRLYGETTLNAPKLCEGQAGLACGECGTTLEDVRFGRAFGCSVCYDVFGDVFLEELFSAHRLPASMKKKGKAEPLHVGRSPGEVREISPSLQLIALNEALSETLKREDYEQAAHLRDQIKAITEQHGEE